MLVESIIGGVLLLLILIGVVWYFFTTQSNLIKTNNGLHTLLQDKEEDIDKLMLLAVEKSELLQKMLDNESRVIDLVSACQTTPKQTKTAVIALLK